MDTARAEYAVCFTALGVGAACFKLFVRFYLVTRSASAKTRLT